MYDAETDLSSGLPRRDGESVELMENIVEMF